jgi:hypothetical protein
MAKKARKNELTAQAKARAKRIEAERQKVLAARREAAKKAAAKRAAEEKKAAAKRKRGS